MNFDGRQVSNAEHAVKVLNELSVVFHIGHFKLSSSFNSDNKDNTNKKQDIKGPHFLKTFFVLQNGRKRYRRGIS